MSRRHPKHLSFACRPKDVSGVAAELGLDLSLFSVSFGEHGIPPALRGPRPAARFEAGRGHARHFGELSAYFKSDFSLTICLVPRPLAGAVRDRMRAEGLAKLLGWLDAQRRLPDTARTKNVALHLDWEDGRLLEREGETPSWAIYRSP